MLCTVIILLTSHSLYYGVRYLPRVSRVLFEGKPKEGDLLVGHRVKQRLNDTVSEPPLLELVHLNHLQMGDSV